MWDANADSLSAGYSGLLRLEAGSQALSCYCAVVPHPAADDTGIRPPGRSGHLAGAIGTRGGPAGSDLRPTPSGHPTPRPAPRPDPQGRHLTGQCRLILRAGIPGHWRPRRRLPREPNPNFFVDAAPEVDRYARDFELLTQIALPQDESAEFIHTIANQLRNNTTSGAL